MNITPRQVINVFLFTFIISVLTLRNITDPIELIRYAFERQVMCFFYSIFGVFGSLIGVHLYNKFKK